jgi:hypothetical protein
MNQELLLGLPIPVALALGAALGLGLAVAGVLASLRKPAPLRPPERARIEAIDPAQAG